MSRATWAPTSSRAGASSSPAAPPASAPGSRRPSLPRGPRSSPPARPRPKSTPPPPPGRASARAARRAATRAGRAACRRPAGASTSLVNCAGVNRRGRGVHPDGLRRRPRHQPQRHDAGLRRRPPAARREAAAPSSTSPRCSPSSARLVARLCREQGRRRPAHQVAGHRLCRRRHPRQRPRAGLDRNADDRRASRPTRPLRRRSSAARRWAAGAQPEDLAGGALFLCSPLAAFITGAILPVDGGYSAM